VPTDNLAADLAADLAGSFERLVLAYQHRLYAFALRLIGSPQDAEEAAQDAFLRAYRALCSYPPERVAALAVRPWLYQITLNVVRNRQRGKRLAVTTLDGPDGRERPLASDGADGPEASLLRAERQAELVRQLATLPLGYRAAVVLRHVEGLSYEEIGQALGIPVGTAKANVHRGARRLRAALTPETSAADRELTPTGVGRCA
jgi:RNA polymerase sigma-70 factor, ECF subfamily